MRPEPAHILLIEDDPGITDTLQRVLAKKVTAWLSSGVVMTPWPALSKTRSISSSPI